MDKFFIYIFLSIIFVVNLHSQKQIVVDVNLDVKRKVGEVTSMDRNKFITIHADVSEREWDGDNFVSDLRDDFLNGYDVYLGRNTGGITWYLNNQISEDPARSGFANPADVVTVGNNVKSSYASKTAWHAYENRNDQIICAQLHPFWPDGQETKKEWSFSQADTQEEPFGTATGEYMARYIQEAFGNGGTSGQAKPNYIEVINEPLWHLVDYGDVKADKIFRFHKNVATEIKKYHPDIPIGGFCTAFPDVEKNDFQRWEERWKSYMDIAGESTDFWTIHLYDFPSINGGKQKYRKGSQMEATFDMMEQYSYLKFGVVKPFMVSEYGAQMHDYNKEWSPYRDWLHVKSSNSMLMQFMDRPHIINKIINFIAVKAEWGYNSATGVVYNHRLMRKENEPTSYTGEWVYSEMAQFYELWQKVKGTRVDSKPFDLDILTDAYVDGNKAYVIINNLKFENVDINLNVLGFDASNLQSIGVKHLHLNGNIPVIDEDNYTSLPEYVSLDSEGTMILEYTFNSDISIPQLNEEVKYYANEYYKPIAANTAETFHLNGVSLGTNGEATLRIGIGRNHGKVLYPTITINDNMLKIPSDYKGDDQKDRDTFFGVLEVNVPYEYLLEDNVVKVTFPDGGGHISSVAMKVFKHSKQIERSASLDVAINLPRTLEFGVYPNPVKNTCLVTKKYFGAATVLIQDMAGKVIKTEEFEEAEKQLNLSALSSGVYLLTVYTNDEYGTKKLIKK